MNYSQTSVLSGAQCEPAHDNTILETHLAQLDKLNENMAAAVSRGQRVADRILGPEPQNIAKGEGNAPTPQPCLVRRLEVALMQANALSESMHRQLERVERL